MPARHTNNRLQPTFLHDFSSQYLNLSHYYLPDSGIFCLIFATDGPFPDLVCYNAIGCQVVTVPFRGEWYCDFVTLLPVNQTLLALLKHFCAYPG